LLFCFAVRGLAAPVAGIQTGAERAFDLFMKARFLGKRKPGQGVVR
jgi:N12 class adenine-specific DNA methylase